MSVASIGPTRTSNSLLDVIDTILDKGLVIDIYIRVSLVGIEILTVEARIVVASVDTYIRYARAVLELGAEFDKDIPLAGSQNKSTLTELPGELAEGITRGASKGKSDGVIESVKEKVRR